MATKRENLDDPNSCLNKAADDEEIFILRAHDLLSPDRVRDWAQKAKEHGAPMEKVAGALEVATKMEAWPDRKYPD